MAYPSLEQYNEALQFPRQALSDPELKQGTVAQTGLGLPLALCGGFALTYTIKTGAKKFAVRCFHKQSPSLEKRYIEISSRLKSLKSRYFVDFEFQPQGVMIAGQAYPVVKMAWASGTTLGQFLEKSHRNPSDLKQLRIALQALMSFLERESIAHGDIQPGNVMVGDSGKTIQLIDYDGMYVDSLKTLGSAELGHRNFQHPKRLSTSWKPSIDRFSFICLDLALRALEAHPELWAKSQSDGDSILFKANDFADPSQSWIFKELFNKPSLAQDTKNFAAICQAGFEKTPSFEDFVSKKNIPQIGVDLSGVAKKVSGQYLPAYPVLDATSYAACLKYVGDKVELIGRIVEVKQATARNGKPYIFINFGPWKGSIVKISIWSEGLDALTNKPGESWVGKWISVVGLMDPPYVNKRYNYSHLSISITQGSQLHFVTDAEAKFRLGGSSTRSSGRGSASGNQDILTNMGGNRASHIGGARSNAPPRVTPSVTSNQATLARMRGSQSAQQPNNTNPRYRGATSSSSSSNRPASNSSNSGCFIATAIYGVDAPETNALRCWRDRVLLPSVLGRTLVRAYYKLSPILVLVIERHGWLKRSTKKYLDKLVETVDRF